MKRKIHIIPTVLIAVMLTLILTAGAVFAVPAGFNFLSTSTAFEVTEPILSTEYNLDSAYGGDDQWH